MHYVLSSRKFSFLRVNRRRQNLDIQISSKNASQLSQTIRIASQKNVKDVKFWNLVKCRFKIIYKSVNARNLSFIANGLSRAKIFDSEIWNLIISRSYELSSKMDYQDIAILSNALCKYGTSGKEAFNVYSECVKNRKDNMPWKYASILIYSYGKIGFKDRDLMYNIIESTLPCVTEMSLFSLSNMVTGLINLKFFHSKLFNAISMNLKKALNEYLNGESSDGNIKSVNNNDIELKHVVSIYRGIAHSNVNDKELYELIFKYMIINQCRLNPVEIFIIADSMYKSKRHNKELINHLCKQILRNKSSFSIDMLCGFMNSISSFKKCDNDFINEICMYVLSNHSMNNITIKNSIILLRIFTKFKLHTPELMEVVYNHIKSNIIKLTCLDLTNVINYLSVINSKKYEMLPFVKHFMDIMEDSIDNFRYLPRLFYSIAKLKDPSYIYYIDIILVHISNSQSLSFNPVNVSNILYGLKWVDGIELKCHLLDKFSKYIIINMDQFSRQLLASSLNSLVTQNYNCPVLYTTFCKNVDLLDKRGTFEDDLNLLIYLNSVKNKINYLDNVNYTYVAQAFTTVIYRILNLAKNTAPLKDELSNALEIMNDLLNRVIDNSTRNLIEELGETLKSHVKC